MPQHTTEILVGLRKSAEFAAKAADRLRGTSDFPDQLAVLRALPPDCSAVTDLLAGICFPREWKDVWVTNRSPRIKSSQKAIKWFTAVCARHADMLGQHANLRLQVNRAALHGQWQDAQRILQNHRDSIGASLWGLAWLLCLSEETGGARVKLELLQSFEGKALGKAIGVFARLYAVCTDKTMSEKQCRDAVRRTLPSDNQHGSFGAFFELLLLQDTPVEWEAWQLLEYLEYLPLVDRYEFFLRLTTLALASGHKDGQRLAGAAIRLAPLCSDPYLAYLADCLSPEPCVEVSAETRLMLRSWDTYLMSRYEESYRFAEELSALRPEIVPAHEILVKSALYLGKTDHTAATTPIESC